jgi:hypothetical protein
MAHGQDDCQPQAREESNLQTTCRGEEDHAPALQGMSKSTHGMAHHGLLLKEEWRTFRQTLRTPSPCSSGKSMSSLNLKKRAKPLARPAVRSAPAPKALERANASRSA